MEDDDDDDGGEGRPEAMNVNGCKAHRFEIKSNYAFVASVDAVMY
jgi:hypothetical protein